MKIVIHCTTNQCGTDSHHFVDLGNTPYTEEEINTMCWEYALNNADTYGISPPRDEEGEMGDDEEFDDNIEGYYEVYDAKKHDMYAFGSTPNWE